MKLGSYHCVDEILPVITYRYTFDVAQVIGLKRCVDDDGEVTQARAVAKRVRYVGV